MVLAEALLFAGNEFVGRWLTPIIWTGYVLFVDALVYRRKRRSLLVSNRLELLAIVCISIGSWWLFEFYNSPRFWQLNAAELWWHYQHLVPDPFLRCFGYNWAFATIFPALFETAELCAAWRATQERLPERESMPARELSKPLLYALIILGAAGALVPFLIINVWLVPLVWVSLALLLDPLNALRGWPSLTGDIARRDWRRLITLALAGIICGVLWEFWNYWAISRWTYTVPYLGNVKIFEMPVLGYLGYPPFAWECWAIYIFCRSLLGGGRPIGAQTRATEIVIDLQ